ncbi:RNA 2',3'-cyclic phosphodiesterase [Nocardioides sp. Soil805]|uniref:RNA 2',3'-cyclic phosphodiesterase n=1 Tax=Nocardioides sp. Soil805 TaxID=1736416 RepID=UPI000702F4C4|nr:RNA 2',3'-cyclic phosphodiesterase [Nocardioides sp. Soil805]KRF37924.1 2'-5' RNA ligase [Nocardioides sp. Soil805]
MFVAVVPPPEAVEDLDDFLSVRRDAGARPDERWRWAPAEQWHLTLAFMEDVADHSVDELTERLAATAGRQQRFASRVVGGGAFPDPDRARVLWAGLEGDFDALSRGARAAANTSGAVVDGQRFRPHLTLARLGGPANVSRWVRLLDTYAGPSWTVDEVALVASYLGEGPRGRPRHEVVATLPLG